MWTSLRAKNRSARPSIAASTTVRVTVSIPFRKRSRINCAYSFWPTSVKKPVRPKSTPTIGRRHGIHAEPVTFGLKLAFAYAEFARNRAHLSTAPAQLATCALSGSVGTFANVDPRVAAHVAAKLGLPVAGGPAFLVGQNFKAVYSDNPSPNSPLALVQLGDLVRGDPPFRQQCPGGERAPTLEEVKEIQRRLTALGYDTGGVDGRVGNHTMIAVQNYPSKIGMHPADGYAGVELLARLRQER